MSKEASGDPIVHFRYARIATLRGLATTLGYKNVSKLLQAMSDRLIEDAIKSGKLTDETTPDTQTKEYTCQAR